MGTAGGRLAHGESRRVAPAKGDYVLFPLTVPEKGLMTCSQMSASPGLPVGFQRMLWGVGTQASREAGRMVLVGRLRQAGRVLPASVTRGWEDSPTAALKSQPRLAGGAEATGALSVYVWTCRVEQTPSLCLREGQALGAACGMVARSQMR